MAKDLDKYDTADHKTVGEKIALTLFRKSGILREHKQAKDNLDITGNVNNESLRSYDEEAIQNYMQTQGQEFFTSQEEEEKHEQDFQIVSQILT